MSFLSFFVVLIFGLVRMRVVPLRLQWSLLSCHMGKHFRYYLLGGVTKTGEIACYRQRAKRVFHPAFVSIKSADMRSRLDGFLDCSHGSLVRDVCKQEFRLRNLCKGLAQSKQTCAKFGKVSTWGGFNQRNGAFEYFLKALTTTFTTVSSVWKIPSKKVLDGIIELIKKFSRSHPWVLS